MTARSRERGSHAGRPRAHGLPFTVPGLPGLGGSRSGKNVPPPPAGEAPAVDAFRPAPHPNGSAPPGTVPRSGGPSPNHGRSRHRKPPERKSLLPGKSRIIVALVVVAAVLAIGFTDGGFGGAGSPEATVASFLLDWEQNHYADAAALTDAAPGEVSTQLAAAYTDLDATSTLFSVKGVTQHGSTAVASYKATVDLAQSGQQWSYTGTFGLTTKHGQWVVNWAPSLINPRLGAGDRLAVVSTYAPRAGVVDMNGQSLMTKSTDYRIGVYPGSLRDPAATAAGFAGVTGLDQQQVLGQIVSAPPKDFLSLLTLDQADFGAMWQQLSKVPGLGYQQRPGQLFGSSAAEVVGQVGTEDSSLLRDEGAAYQPGTTVGLTGYEQAFQDQLAGTPTTSVVVVNAAGHTIATLWTSPNGRAGTPVQTTLNAKEQTAATRALAGAGSSAEIVGIDWRTGQIRVLASRQAGHAALPAGGALNAKVAPGMSFSIVSAAALLSSGVSPSHPLPCEPVADVGGMTFTYQPSSSTATLASDFANGCGTAFANMSRTLTAQQLASAERAFGIGASWQLRLPAFSGSAAATSGEADVAAQVTGTRGVLVSPLGMATVAAEVAAGTGRSPVLLGTDTSATWQAPVSGAELSELRQLMRLAVTKGSAHAANVSGTPVYGQAGVVQSGAHSYLSWFVGYRGSLAVAVLETGATPGQAAAALAGTFLKSVG